MPGPAKTFLTRRLARFVRDERGATAIEYALIAIGVAVAISATVYSLGGTVMNGYYERIAKETAATTP